MTLSFDQAVHRYHPLLLRRAVRLTGNPTDAEDVMQEAWLMSWRGWDAIVATPSVVACLKINTYRAFLWWKRARTARVRGGGVDHGQVDDWSDFVAGDGAQEATVMLGQIPTLVGKRDAEALFALAAGDTLAEIGARRGVSGEAVRQQLALARSRLDATLLSTKG